MNRTPSTDDEAFLRSILDAPGDDAPRLVYADWLDERGDPRGAFVRDEVRWARDRSAAGAAELRARAAALDPVWAARVARPPVGACCDRLRFAEPFKGLTRPAVGPDVLDRFESRYAIRFPPDYRAFLLDYNGGVPNPNAFLVPAAPEMGPDAKERVEHLYYFNAIWSPDGSPVHEEADLTRRFQLEADFADSSTPSPFVNDPVRDMLVIGRGWPTGELEWLCLGVRGAIFGRVFFIDPYLDHPLAVRPMADTFAECLSLFAEHPQAGPA
jgi:uncharacterized protein (TIGR02996 family)